MILCIWDGNKDVNLELDLGMWGLEYLEQFSWLLEIIMKLALWRK